MGSITQSSFPRTTSPCGVPLMASIRELNDAFRQTLMGGRLVFTQGILALPNETAAQIISKLVTFDGFGEGNDPYGEHDFGQIMVDGTKVFFKIDYYDQTLKFGSEDPSDPSVTSRVLTVMLAEEY